MKRSAQPLENCECDVSELIAIARKGPLPGLHLMKWGYPDNLWLVYCDKHRVFVWVEAEVSPSQEQLTELNAS